MTGELIIILTAAAALTAAVIVAAAGRSRTRKIMNSLDAMIDSAINGTFEELRFDESLQSAVETKLAQYLSKSVSTEKNLKEEKDRIKELVADISHQTKTPISNIMLYGQLLQEKELEEDTQAAISSLNEQAEKLSFLIQSLVKTSRLETGVFAIHRERGNIKKVVEDAAGQAGLEAAKKQIKLTLELIDIEALFDGKWTMEALYNIIDNAIKYTPEGGTVGITMDKYEMFCRIAVKDSGMGISEDEQSKVFARFYRSPQVAGQKGVGIGLYLTRQILSAEDGYVEVKSKPGEGTVFSVYLPLP